MKQNKLHITLLLFLIWNFCFAQQYSNYSTKNGLPSNHVYRITQDIDGFIWFITDKGMVKFNGTDFKKYTIRDGLPTNDIWNIVTTPNGKVWYFSKSPKIGYIDKDSVYSFPSAIKGEILSPMNRNITGNHISFNNSIGHYELENKQWKCQDVLGSYSSQKQWKIFIKHKKLNHIQFKKNKESLLFIDKKGNELKRIKITFGITLSHTRGQVNDSTYIWLHDKAYTVLNLNNFKLKTTAFKDVINIKKSKYVRIHVVNNQIQITGKGFVSVLDENYNLTKTHYIPNHLKAHFSFIDKQDNLWIATFTNGVYKLPKSKQNSTYTLANEKVGKIKKIDDKLITTVLDKGFYQYNSNNKQLEPYIKETEFTYGVFQIKELDKKYFITSNKITTVHNKNRTTLYATKANHDINETARQLIYHNKYLYGNFTSGLNRLNPENISVNKRIFLQGIRTFNSFKNELIIATSNGLKILKKDSIVPMLFPKTNNIYKKPILSLNKLDENTLLVGTDSYGAFITDLEKIIPLKETEFLSINDSFIENNNLWLATDKGVWHYKKDNATNYNFITSYNENDGLLLKNAKSVYATDENLIISSNIGVTTIPKKKTTNQELLMVYIAEIKYDDKKTSLNKAKYTKNNTLNFSVSSIDFSEKVDFRYEYKLLPVQKKWISTTSKQISFTDLQPDNYELHIKVKEKSDHVAFKITPLWWQTLFAQIVFTILSALLFIALILNFRKKELKKQAAKLNAEKKLADFELHALRSQMNPHFVFNSLNAIQYYITKNETDLSEKYLVKFSRLIRMFFDFSREKEISLFNEIKLLNGYLEIEQMRFGKDFKFNIHIDDSLEIHKKTIPTMLLQPIVENAVNHGIFHNDGKGLIEIYFTYIDDNAFEINIIDDGVGIQKSKEIQQQSIKKHDSKSTEILYERIELLNQSKLWNVIYSLKNNLSNGTTVQLIFKKHDKN